MRKLFIIYILLLTIFPIKGKAQSEKLNISGFTNLQYTYNSDGNSFHIRRARLDFKGSLHKMVDYRLQLELTSPKIVDAFVKLKFHPMFNVQVGQFKLPFTIENPISPLKLEAIDNAQVISALSSFADVSGVHSMGRGLGLAIYGSFLPMDGFSVIEYNVGLFNGNGVNTKDDNKHKDLVGKLYVHPVKHLTLGASAYLGKMNTDIADQLGTKNSYALSGEYNDGKIIARSEYLWGNTNELKSDGVYGLVGYWITNKFCPVLRYDTYRKNTEAEKGRSTYYMIGIDYWPWKFVRCQANYTLKDIQSHDKVQGQVALMVSVKF